MAAVSGSLATKSRLLFSRPWIIEKQQSSLSIGGRCGSLARFFSASLPAKLNTSAANKNNYHYNLKICLLSRINLFSSLIEHLWYPRCQRVAWHCTRTVCDSVRSEVACSGYPPNSVDGTRRWMTGVSTEQLPHGRQLDRRRLLEGVNLLSHLS